MARALALTPECLDCTSGGGDTVTETGTTGPNVIVRPPSEREPVGGLPITQGGGTQTPVTVGTSALPSSTGPTVLPPPPGAEPTPSPALGRRLLIGVGLLIAALLLTSAEKPRPK